MSNDYVIEKLHENNLMYFYLGGLINSNNLSSISDCERSLRDLNRLKESLPKAKIENECKAKYAKFIEDGFEEVNKYLRIFQNKN